MTDEALQAHNARMLEGLHTVTRAKVAGIIAAMLTLGWRCRIQCGWRSPAKQMEAYRKGNSKLQWGLHCATSKSGVPESLAADIIKDDDDIDINGEDDLYRAPVQYYVDLAHYAKQYGMVTGITWGLPEGLKAVLQEAIDNRSVYTGKKGWDAGHVQENVSSLRAKLGWRPKT
jgi:hypothetical protein